MQKPLLITTEPPTWNRAGICLNMIVKDETPVLERLFRSVKDVIDYFVIVDTGSTDGTPELIQRLADIHGLQGEVHLRDWVNFGHNRQQALELAVASGRADWLLFIDADEELAWCDPEWTQTLQPGITYQLEKHHDDVRYALSNLIWVRGLEWRWQAVVHEYVACQSEHPVRRLSDAWIIYHAGEGARSRGASQREKFLRDAALLEAEVLRDPRDARSRFYLAQSYRDAGELAKAYKHYGQRVDLGGWNEEVFIAQCERGRLAIQLGYSHSVILTENLKAFSLRPTRAEPLWQLAQYCRMRERYAEGYVFANTGKAIPLPADSLFIRRSVYDWQMLDEYSVCASWIGRYQEAAEAGQRLLDEARFPADQEQRIRDNLQLSLQKIIASTQLSSPNTLVNLDELRTQYGKALAYLKDRLGPDNLGDYLEFGVYRGDSFRLMHQLLRAEGLNQVRLVGFDSFAGLPEDCEGIFPAGALPSDYEELIDLLERDGVDWSRVKLIKGLFEATLTDEVKLEHGIQKASFIMVDCDLYASAKAALDFCGPLIHDEAIIFFDDWNPLAGFNHGEKRAFDEFLSENPSFQVESWGSWDYRPGDARGKVFRIWRQNVMGETSAPRRQDGSSCVYPR